MVRGLVEIESVVVARSGFLPFYCDCAELRRSSQICKSRDGKSALMSQLGEKIRTSISEPLFHVINESGIRTEFARQNVVRGKLQRMVMQHGCGKKHRNGGPFESQRC
jgi:hypothetical protein